ncbi:MAG: metallophosphoesterase [Clostridiales bacterium]|nr:metallophosphoesterase [Clostridiales bacterium]
MGKIKPLYEGVRLLCVITTDNHIDAKHSVSPGIPLWFNGKALKDSQQSKAPVDVFLTIGDTTSRGSVENWELVKGLFAKYRPAKQVLLTVGNHDLWADGGFEEALKNYLDYSNLICGTDHEKTWFSHTVNGYKLIFLGNTTDAGCEAHLGREQIEWLKAELDAAEGRPAFVFCHQSLNRKHGLPVTWDASGKSEDPLDGGLGEESDEVEAILKAHKNVFYFSGHSHMGIGGENCLKENGYSSFENDGGVELVNLPSMACGNHHGEDKSTGVGCVLEVYDDRVVLRPRNFAKRAYNSKIMIRDGKPYLEKMLDR